MNIIGLAEIRKAILSCEKCDLCKTVTNKVVGEIGVSKSIAFVGEGPGEDEDMYGRPFVGKSGQLLRGAIKMLGVDLQKVSILNTVKCRTPNNRVPSTIEIQFCKDFLEAQLGYIEPTVVVAVGSVSMKWLTGIEKGITKLNGQTFSSDQYNLPYLKNSYIHIVVHPSYILRKGGGVGDYAQNLVPLKCLCEKIGVDCWEVF